MAPIRATPSSTALPRSSVRSGTADAPHLAQNTGERCRLDALASSPHPIDADERRVALYVSGHRLTPLMRHRRRELEEAVTAGVDAVGIDRIVGLATVSWELRRRAEHLHDAHTELVRLWPDGWRWEVAGQLAETAP